MPWLPTSCALSELLGLPLIEVILTRTPGLDYVPFDYTLEECFNMALGK